jgi:CobQ-like glutamine amidotransferase family enzyme
MTALKICVVYPDLLGTYGDGGNGEILAARARWRGIDAELVLASSTEELPQAALYCLGGGEDGPQVLAAERLAADGRLVGAVADGASVLAVCAGYQIVGESFPETSGERRGGLGLLGVATAKGKARRAVGEVVADVVERSDGGLGLGVLSGFENHGGISVLLDGTAPLARVRHGIGNGGGDGTEGAVSGRVVGTYLHGPVLARNPELADQLLCWALDRTELEPLDDAIALDLRRERLASLRLATSREGSARRR